MCLHSNYLIVQEALLEARIVKREERLAVALVELALELDPVETEDVEEGGETLHEHDHDKSTGNPHRERSKALGVSREERERERAYDDSRGDDTASAGEKAEQDLVPEHSRQL